MKLKVVIIDLEIPLQVKKWGLRIGIPVALLLAGGAIAYATLPQPSFMSQEVLTAAALNSDFNSLDTRVTALEAAQTAVATLQGNVTTLQSSVSTIQTSVSTIQAADNNFVDLTSNQTVGGTKTFSGAIFGGLTSYEVAGSSLTLGGTSGVCTVDATQFSANCYCPSGAFVVSGGGASPGVLLSESRPIGTTGWRVTCAMPTGAVTPCLVYDLVCSRLGP